MNKMRSDTVSVLNLCRINNRVQQRRGWLGLAFSLGLLAMLALPAAAQTDSAQQSAQQLRQMFELGDYEKVIALMQEQAPDEEPDRERQLVLADSYLAVGEADEARKLWQSIISVADPISTIARSRLGRLEIETGDRREGYRLLTQAFDHYQQNTADYSMASTLAAADAVASLSTIDPALTELALDFYEAALALAPDDPRPHTAIGDFLLSRYNSSEATAAYQDALKLDEGYIPALFGIASAQHFDRDSTKAAESLDFVLEVQPNYVPALLLQARLAVDKDDFEAAEDSVARALEIQKSSPAALSLAAAVHYLRDEEADFTRITQQIRQQNPGYFDLYLLLAEVAAQHRRYQNAVEFSAIAVNLHPRAWRAHALLGINRLRLGDMNRGRFNLERAFQGNPFDIWTKNTLDLLDQLDGFTQQQSDRFILVADPEESEVLAPYLIPIAERAYDYYEQRYRHSPPVPIRIEVYPDHQDFSVRTVGLVGVDIVGVSFGPVVAFDSPSSRVFGDFNWASVLWHEIAHSFHIDMSDGKVPRWFTEGLSVYEERRGGPGWGNDVTDSFLTAYKDGKLMPASDLDQSFLRPTYAEQIPHAYYQASLIMDMIEQQHGFDAIIKMLRGFANGNTTANMIAEILNTSAGDFDKAFEQYLQNRFEKPLAAMTPAPGSNTSEYSQLLQSAVDILKDGGDDEEAETKLIAAQGLFPQRAGAGSSYRLLARLYVRRGEFDKAIEQLAANIAIDADDLEAHRQLAELYEQKNDLTALADTLERSLHIQPFDAETHQRLGQIFADSGQWTRAVGSRAAAMALNPTDPVEARYQYAQALENTNQRQKARHELLRTLEQAPMYEEALELLLQMKETDATQEPRPSEEKSE